MTRFDNKVVIITGAGGGLGRSHALAFAAQGAKTVVNDLGGTRDGTGGDNSMADQVVKEIRAAGGVAVANYDSVATAEGAAAIVGTALREFGRLDIFVNNAGILRDKTLLKMTDEQWRAVIEVHLTGTFNCSRAAARAMAEQGEGGRIINTTSIAGLKGNYGQTNYAAAKAGIYGMTLTTGMELAKHQVTVNAVAPIAKTRLTQELAQVSEELKPEMITPMVVYLASDEAAAVTGRVFGVHGRHLFEYKMQLSDGVRSETDWSVETIAHALPQIASFEAAKPVAPAADVAPASAAPDESPTGRVAAIFARMPDAFLPTKAGSWSAVMHFQISGAGNHTVTVADGTCKTAAGLEGTASCVVGTDADTFLGMVDGTVDGQQAFMQGKVTATNLTDMMKYKTAFSKEKSEAKAAPGATPAATPAASSSTSTPKATPTDADPTDLVAGIFENAQDLFGKTQAPMQVDLELGDAGHYRFSWDDNGARAQRDPQGKPPAARVRTDAKTLLGVIDGSIEPRAAVDSFALTVTRMGDFTRWTAALRDSDWMTTVTKALADRPVWASREVRTKTFHGEPAIARPEHVLAYAAATDDRNAAYQSGAVPPIFAVRYHLDLARQVLTDPGVTADLMRLVHGEQEIIFHRPLRQGDVLSPKANLHAVEHKASGSLCKVRFRIMRDGELANEAISSYFVRGPKKAGDAKKPAPQRLESHDFERTVTVRDDQSREYALASLDQNPIHVDDDIARSAGFKGVILHGLCTLAFASQAVVEGAADNKPERLASIRARFSRPVSMGDRLTTRGKVIEEQAGLSQIAFETFNQNNELVITHGRATVRSAV